MYNKETPASIQSLFDSIAKSYDRTNAILSFGMHRFWNRALIRHTALRKHPKAFLDLCSGTGEIAFHYLKQPLPACHSYLLDFSSQMLECARAKAEKLQLNPETITYLHADAQAIPLSDNSVDCATIAYGIRNVRDPYSCFQEVFRVLQPGGIFGILELTRPSQPILKFGHALYLRTLLPFLGKCFSANEEAYQYLSRSIQNFVKPSELSSMLQQVGFEEISIIPLSGGISTIIVAKKLSSSHIADKEQ